MPLTLRPQSFIRKSEIVFARLDGIEALKLCSVSLRKIRSVCISLRVFGFLEEIVDLSVPVEFKSNDIASYLLTTQADTRRDRSREFR